MSVDLVLRGATTVAHIEGTVHVSRATGQRATSTVSIRANRGTAAGGDEVGLYVDGVRIFGGIVQESKKSRVGNVQTNDTLSELICIGWEHRLDRHVLGSKIYSGMTAGAIITDLITTECASEGLTVGTIGAGASAADLGQIRFNGETVASALDDLATRSNYNWWITPDKVIHFIAKTSTTAGTLVLSSASKNFAGLTISETGEDYVNCVKIGIGWDQIGATAIPGNLGSGAVDTGDPNYGLMTGNGVVRTWTIPNVSGVVQAIDHIDKILLNGIPQEVGILNVDSDAGKAFFYAVNSNVITQNSTYPVLSSADHIQVYYYVVGRNVIVAEDAAEITARATIEGGSGRYELYVDDTQNSDQVGALKKAQKILDTRCPGRNGAAAGTWPRVYEFPVYSYTPNSIDLQPGSVISISCVSPSTGGAKSVLIQSVESTEIIGKSTDGSRNFLLHTAKAVDYVPVGDVVDFFQSLTGSSGSVTVTATGSGTSPVTPPAAGSTPPGNVTLGTPVLTYLPNGDAQISIAVTPPVSLGTFTQVYAYLAAPDATATKPAAINNAVTGFVIGNATDASSVVGPVQYFPYGPFKLEAAGMIITLAHPAPLVSQTWRIYVTSASSTIENQLVPANEASPTPSVFLTVAPYPASASGAEYGPNARNVTGAIVYPSVEIGADQFWKFNLAWTNPTEDPRFPFVDFWDIVLFDPATNSAGVIGGYQLVSGEPASVSSYNLPDRWKIPDIPVTFIIYVVPRRADGYRNTIVNGVTGSVELTPVRQSGVLGHVSGFSVTVTYSAADNDGYREMWLDPVFFKPGDSAFAYIEFWAYRSDLAQWFLLGYPAESGAAGRATISNIPKTITNWTFLAVSQDANDRDRDGNTTTNPVVPPAGSPTYGPISVSPPQLGGAGAEYTGNVTGVTITAAYPAASDGTNNVTVSAVYTAPASDTTWGGVELISFDGVTYTSRANSTVSPITAVLPVPTSPVTWTWFLVSFDVNGRRNTIQAITPQQDLVIGTASGSLNGAKLITASVSTVKLDATEISVGGGGGKPGKFGVYNAAGTQIGFIGVEFGNEGGWFKTLAVGGSSYGSAQLKADASGNVSLVGGSVNIVSGTVTIAIDASNKVKLTDSAISSYAQINGGFIDLGPTSGSGTCRLARSTITFAPSFGGSNYLVIDGSSAPSIALYPSAGILRTFLDSSGQIFLYNAGGTLVFRADNLGWVEASNGFSRGGVQGISTTINYTKFGGASGNLTFIGGILTASS